MSANGGPPWVEEAKRLRAGGLSYGKVAQHVGVTEAAVYKRLNPDRAREYARRQEARPERKVSKRQWEREHTTPCVDCGELTSEGYRRPTAKKPPSRRCPGCEVVRRHEIARERTSRWLELRRQGFGNKDIAEREGIKPHVVATALQQSHIARFEDLEWLPAPYAAKRGVAA